MLLTDTALNTKDERIINLVSFDVIAKRYGWTFDYILSLPVPTLKGIKAIMSAERRLRRFREQQRKNRGKGR